VLIPGGSLAGGAAARPVAPAICMAEEPSPLDVEVRKLPKSSIALDIKVSKEVTNEIHLKTLAKLAKGAKVPGFRDGKVPPQAVIAKLGMQKVKEATVEQIVDAGMQHSGVGQRIHTVGEARLPEELEGLAARYTVGEPLDFTVEVDVYPEAPVDEAKYKALSVEVEREAFNQEAYDAALFKLRKQHAASVDMGASTGAAPGNALKVNMNGYLATPDGAKGEALPAVAGGDGIEIPMEEGKFMPGLVEGLVGATQGETRDITVTFPARSSAAMLSGKTAIFEVEVLNVFRKELPEPGDDFADQVKSGMTWAELDEKLKEGVMADAEDKQGAKTRQALEQALVATLPDDFELPETLVEQVTKERFAQMLGDMRERGASDEKIKELITPENYERYKTISRPQNEGYLKGNFAIKAVGMQQGLSVSQNEIDDEVMTLQAQALQRKEKFKESEVRPKVAAQLERDAVLNWLETHATVTLVDPKEFDPDAVLGASPEELAAKLAAQEGVAAPDATGAPPPAPKAAAPPPTPESPSSSPPPGGGFEWGATF